MRTNVKDLFKSQRIILFLILIIATILRTINIGKIAYMHDELSVLSRLDYNSFSELIRKGVLPDFHPPLVQVFIFYWVKVVGYQEWIVKLPFIIMGISSVYFIYWIGRKWFSENTGIAAAAFIACSEPAIQYSQIIRPYGSGLFFCLLLIITFIKGFEENIQNKKYKYLFSVSIALCGYNHHFSLVFAGLFGLFAILLLPKNKILDYLLFCSLGFILYLPNIYIFLKQMSYGGIGEWLGKPSKYFIIEFFRYFSHFNIFILLLLFISLLISIIYIYRYNKTERKHLFICLIIFSSSYLLAFLYSIKVNPILQYSTLFFSTPLMFIGIFSFLKYIKIYKIIFNLSIILLMVCLSFTLIYSRNYYELMSDQPMERYSNLTFKATKEYPNSKVLINTESWFINFYQTRNKIPFKFETFHQKGITDYQFLNWLKSGNSNYFIGANLPENWILLAKYYYPYILKKEFGYTYEWFLFSKILTKSLFEPIYENVANKNNNWEIKSDKINLNIYEIAKETKTDIIKTFNLSEIINNRNYYLSISAEIKLKNKTEDAILVESIEPEYGGEPYDWRGASFKNQINLNDTVNWQPVGIMNRVKIIYSSDNLLKNSILKVYVWNNKKANFLIRNFKLSIYNGNKDVFKLYYE
jgi:4-amino-4-deoxy-L-arabinose transferase-like glycosyltransferase